MAPATSRARTSRLTEREPQPFGQLGAHAPHDRRRLVLQVAKANPSWGYRRVQDEIGITRRDRLGCFIHEHAQAA